MKNDGKQRSPEEQHRRQAWLEIGLPLGIALLVIVAVIAWVILAAVHGSSTGISQAAAISLIFLIIPTFFVVLILIVLVSFIDYGLMRGNRALPGVAQIVRSKVDTVAITIQKILNSAVSGVDAVSTWFASLQKIFNRSTPPKG